MNMTVSEPGTAGAAADGRSDLDDVYLVDEPSEVGCVAGDQRQPVGHGNRGAVEFDD
jgi:hypothetical protein